MHDHVPTLRWIIAFLMQIYFIYLYWASQYPALVAPHRKPGQILTDALCWNPMIIKQILTRGKPLKRAWTIENPNRRLFGFVTDIREQPEEEKQRVKFTESGTPNELEEVEKRIKWVSCGLWGLTLDIRFSTFPGKNKRLKSCKLFLDVCLCLSLNSLNLNFPTS